MKLKNIVENFENLEEKIIVIDGVIQSNLLDNLEIVNNLEINKDYYTRDFDGHFCSYYLIRRVSDNAVVFIPLWEQYNKDNFKGYGVYETGETDDDIIYGIIVELDLPKYEYLNKSNLLDYVNQNYKDGLTLIDLWGYGNSEYVLFSNKEEEEFINSTMYTFYKTRSLV